MDKQKDDIILKIKKTLRPYVPDIILSLRNCLRYREKITSYKRGLKYIALKKRSENHLKIVFIVQFPETWNSVKTIYEAAVEKHIDALILCIPKPNESGVGPFENNGAKTNEAKEYFDGIHTPAVNAFDNENSTWFDLEKYAPDYVIYTRVYNRQYPSQYQNSTVCRYAKVCYIPYAYPTVSGTLLESLFNNDFMYSTYITFAPSKSSLKKCRKQFKVQDISKSNKYVFLGFPRFDLQQGSYKPIEKKGTKRIAWFPRWVFQTTTEGQRNSSFFVYFDRLMEYMEVHGELELIIRPHPLMFGNIVKEGIMTESEVESLKQRIVHAANVRIDDCKDYIPIMESADILISDFTSLLMEYFMTGKPIIYCDESKDFMPETKLMDETVYHASDWEDLSCCLRALCSGEDVKYNDRKNAVAQLTQNNAGHIGKDILDYIIADFKSEEKRNGR